MVSIGSVRDNLVEEATRILILLQEGDSERGFTNIPWADEMFMAHLYLEGAIKALDAAMLVDPYDD